MSGGVQRWPLTNRVWRQFEVFDLVMDRTRVDAACAARKDAGKAIAKARIVCLVCPAQDRCRSLLASKGNPYDVMEICPNTDFFAQCRSQENLALTVPDASAE